MTWQEASELFAVGIATVNRLVRMERETGSLAPREHGGGQPHLIPDEQLPLVGALVNERADSTLAELCDSYREATGVATSEKTMGRALARLGLSRKQRQSSTLNARSRGSKPPGSRSATSSRR
jgi:transposase